MKNKKQIFLITAILVIAAVLIYKPKVDDSIPPSIDIKLGAKLQGMIEGSRFQRLATWSKEDEEAYKKGWEASGKEEKKLEGMKLHTLYTSSYTTAEEIARKIDLFKDITSNNIGLVLLTYHDNKWLMIPDLGIKEDEQGNPIVSYNVDQANELKIKANHGYFIWLSDDTTSYDLNLASDRHYGDLAEFNIGWTITAIDNTYTDTAKFTYVTDIWEHDLTASKLFKAVELQSIQSNVIWVNNKGYQACEDQDNDGICDDVDKCPGEDDKTCEQEEPKAEEPKTEEPKAEEPKIEEPKILVEDLLTGEGEDEGGQVTTVETTETGDEEDGQGEDGETAGDAEKIDPYSNSTIVNVLANAVVCDGVETNGVLSGTDNTEIINTLIENAEEGSTLYFPDVSPNFCGITGAIIISKPLRIMGDGKESGSEIRMMINNGGYIFDIISSDVVIDGMRLIGYSYGDWMDVSATGGITASNWDLSNDRLSNISIINNRIQGFEARAISFGNVEDFVIKNNHVEDISYSAIMLGFVWQGIITENSVIDINKPEYCERGTNLITGEVDTSVCQWMNGYSIVVSSCGASPCAQDIIISKNIVSKNPMWTAIMTHGSQRTLFDSNEIRDANTVFGLTSGGICFTSRVDTDDDNYDFSDEDCANSDNVTFINNYGNILGTSDAERPYNTIIGKGDSCDISNIEDDCINDPSTPENECEPCQCIDDPLTDEDECDQVPACHYEDNSYYCSCKATSSEPDQYYCRNTSPNKTIGLWINGGNYPSKLEGIKVIGNVLHNTGMYSRNHCIGISNTTGVVVSHNVCESDEDVPFFTGKGILILADGVFANDDGIIAHNQSVVTNRIGERLFWGGLENDAFIGTTGPNIKNLLVAANTILNYPGNDNEDPIHDIYGVFANGGSWDIRLGDDELANDFDLASIAVAGIDQAVHIEVTNPAVPTNLLAESNESGIVELNWEYPEVTEELHDSFYIEQKTSSGEWIRTAYRPANDSMWKFDAPTNPYFEIFNPLNWQVEGLISRETYSFRIRANNGAGISDWSNEVTVTVL